MTEHKEGTPQYWIDKYIEAYAAANGKETAARLSASYNNGWVKLELAPEDTSYWTGPEWYKNVRLRELAQMTENLRQQVARTSRREQAKRWPARDHDLDMSRQELEALRDCPECGDPVMDVENDDEEPVVVGKCCITCDWYEEYEKPVGPLHVTVRGHGDPEEFAASYVRIACRHGTFRIKLNSDLGLRISAEDGLLRIIPQAANAVLLKEE